MDHITETSSISNTVAALPTKTISLYNHESTNSDTSSNSSSSTNLISIPPILKFYKHLSDIDTNELCEIYNKKIPYEAFMEFLQINVEDPRYKFFWNLKPSDTIVIDETLLEWMGYTGDKIYSKSNFRKLLDRNNIKFQKIYNNEKFKQQYIIVMKYEDFDDALLHGTTQKCRELKSLYRKTKELTTFYRKYCKSYKLMKENKMLKIEKSSMIQVQRQLLSKQSELLDQQSELITIVKKGRNESKKREEESKKRDEEILSGVNKLVKIAQHSTASIKRTREEMQEQVVPCTMPKLPCLEKENIVGLYRIKSREMVKKVLMRTLRMKMFKDENAPYFDNIIAGWYTIRTQRRSFRATEAKLFSYVDSNLNVDQIARFEIGHAINAINLMKDKLHHICPEDYTWDARGNTLVMLRRRTQECHTVQVGVPNQHDHQAVTIMGEDANKYMLRLFTDCIFQTPATGLVEKIDEDVQRLSM